MRARVAAHIADVRELLRHPNLERKHRLALLGLLAYLLNPIDLIPDFIPVIGYLDDVAIAAAVLAWIARDVRPPTRP